MDNRFLGAALAALTMAGSANAADNTIRISQDIQYRSDAVGGALIRAECDWGRDLSASIVRNAHGAVEATDADLSTLPGRTLHIVITKAHAAGGGAVSGPKWGRIYGELKQDGAVVGNFTLKRTTNRPFTFRACTTLTQIADKLGEDVAGWLRNPTLDPAMNVERASQ